MTPRKALRFAAIIIALPVLASACKKEARASDAAAVSAEAVETIDRDAMSEEVIATSMADSEAAPSQKGSPFTSFTVNNRHIQIPSIQDLMPIIDKISKEGKKIKSIDFYGLSISGGIGYVADVEEDYNKANSLRQAKEYATLLRGYKLDPQGNIVSITLDPMEEYGFKYDAAGHPVQIDSEAEGYRGGPSYKIRYDIGWEGNTPASYSRKVIEYEAEYDENSKPPFETDFTANTNQFVSTLLSSTGSDILVSGNTSRLMADGSPVWCEITYY